MTTTTLEQQVRAAVETVPDPELPPVTMGMLGMVHAVEVVGSRASIELLPTFAGCPATEMMERDVVAAVSAIDGIDEVRVAFRYSPAWTPERIDDEGRERLREFGIAPPTGAGTVSEVPDDARRLPLMGRGPATGHRACPYCGSDDTVQDSPFGPTPCRDVRHCNTCDQPFEAFKEL